MIVLKFGGTSVGTAENIKKVATIVMSQEEQVIVVLSAVSGTTNALVEINHQLAEGNKSEAKILIEELQLSYHDLIDQLYTSEYYQLKALTFVRNIFDKLSSLEVNDAKTILAQGEIISTSLFKFYLDEISIKASLISALDFIELNENAEPDIKCIKNNLASILKTVHSNIYITQGFICKNHFGNIDNLKRGGSDYTASLIGAAINADQIQIWTDIDGMHNNDPRYVENTFSIDEISFDEAAELAYF